MGNCRKIFLFYPIDEFFYDWDHVAYKGGNPTDFKHAPPCYEVFKTFNEWCDDDVIWWHTPSAHMRSFVNKVVLNTENTKQPIILCEYMPGFLNGEGVAGVVLKELMHDPIFHAVKSEAATKEDLQI